MLFSSKNAYAQLTQSRRDDLISLAYLLIVCMDPKQGWMHHNLSKEKAFQKVSKFKINTEA